MTNTTEILKGEYYTIFTHSSDVAIFGRVLAVSAHGVKVQGYGSTPSRWVTFRSISSAHRANISRLMNVHGK